MFSASLKNPYQWITSVYFFQSMPFVVVNVIATIMYQQHGMSNAQAALLTSLLALPWAIKPLFSPFLEHAATKKRITIITQLVLVGLFFMIGFCVNTPYFLNSSIVLLLGVAIVSSLHDIASDGLYLLSLTAQEQKRYVALRSFFYQMGSLVIKGGLLAFIGSYALHHEIKVWQVFFWSLALLAGVLTTYHILRIPDLERLKPSTGNPYFSVFKTLLRTPKLYSALLFIFLYNLSEAQMQKIIPLFLLDKTGLALNLSQVGEIYGIAGSLFLMGGIFISGLLITRYSLSSCVKNLTILLVIGHFLFFVLSRAHVNPYFLYGTLFFNQFTVGLANGAYMGYLLWVANQNHYSMSMYTLCTTVMALSTIFFGALSGLIEQQLGYSGFFLYIAIANGVLLLMTFKMMNNDV